jgi:alpha-beta hydrolase superfamily lysophospholipase
MIEKSITARDGKTIYYTLDEAENSKSDKVIIIGHGLTSHRFEYPYHVATSHMVQSEYDVARIAFYCEHSDARHLDECTVQIHANDLNDLIKNLKNNYKTVFYAGHSYGGLTALLANPDVKATAFWDSTYVPDFLDDEVTYLPELDCYKLSWGIGALLSKAMVDEAKELTYEKLQLKAKEFNSPALVISAGDNHVLMPEHKVLFDNLNEPKKRVMVKNAFHNFLEKGTAQKLAKETIDWFDAYC